jgi:cell division protein ZapE
MAQRFKMISVEGEDYRHRPTDAQSQVLSKNELFDWCLSCTNSGHRVSLDDFDSLLRHLATLHPTKYGALISGFYAIAIEDVFELQDQVAALRFVAFVDRLYEAQVRVRNSGIPITKVFSDEMVGGTYRKKYLRAVSRLGALTSN